mmetsp:Transcript_103226/g.291487  ORF Transcript_103226/g.291487 Transcript_103226/m.291487 type:complete len:420 (+) Transcript_103226:554-1813(+)
MHRVSHEDDVAIGPRAEELGPTVVQVSLLDRFHGSVVQHMEHFARPAFVQRLEVRNDIGALLGRGPAALPRVARLLGAGRQGQERVPLDSAVANVGRDEVALRPDVNLIATVVVVVELQHRLAREDGIAGVWAALSGVAVLRSRLNFALAVHLGPHRRPNAIGADENVGLGGRAVGQLHGDTVVVVGVAHDRPPVLDEVGIDLPALVYQDVLQVRPVDHAGVRQLEEVRALLEREGDEPIGGDLFIEKVSWVCNVGHPEGTVRAQPVLDAATSCRGETKFVHHPLEKAFVDSFERGRRVAGQLDGTTKTRELAGFLVDGHVPATLEHAQRCRQPANTAAGDRDAEPRTLLEGGLCKGFRRGRSSAYKHDAATFPLTHAAAPCGAQSNAAAGGHRCERNRRPRVTFHQTAADHVLWNSFM